MFGDKNDEFENQLNIFNDANTEYQGKLQESIQQSQINAQETQSEASLLLQKENQEYGAKLQKYSSNLNKYQADVTKEVQEYQQKLFLCFLHHLLNTFALILI